MDLASLILIAALVFIVAALYSSVGHGGASGYLAILSFFSFSPSIMSSTALVLNVLVAGVALVSYYRAGHLSFKLVWPFLIVSIPMAFVGGVLHVGEKTYYLILAVVLVIAAYRLAMARTGGNEELERKEISLSQSLPLGAGIGLLSGVVGVGGGIFLSPIMILMRWATAKQTAAVSALFIVVNSLAGLGGRFLKGGFEFGPFPYLVLVAFLGGLIGSYYGARKFSGIVLRRLLSLVLVIAAVKLVLAVF